jgi:hypothetical protein
MRLRSFEELVSGENMDYFLTPPPNASGRVAVPVFGTAKAIRLPRLNARTSRCRTRPKAFLRCPALCAPALASAKRRTENATPDPAHL